MEQINRVKFDQEACNNFIMQHEIIKLFEEPIKLVSGRTSFLYANCRVLLNTMGQIDAITDFILAFVHDKNFDYFIGVPEGATKLGDILNYKLGKIRNNPQQRLVIGRGKSKEHGIPKDRHFIGDMQQGDKVLVIEDVTNTGNSLLKIIQQVEEAGVTVVGAVAIFNRMQKTDDGKSVAQALAEKNIPFFYLTDSFQMLPLIIQHKNISPSIIEKIKNEFKKYGVKELC